MDKEIRNFLETMQNGMNEFRSEFQDFRKETTKRFEGLEKDVKGLDKRFEGLEKDVKGLDKRVEGLEENLKDLKEGQEEIKTIIGQLDPLNANRHLELKDSIEQLRKDLSTVEIVTASNYSDIARLKNIR